MKVGRRFILLLAGTGLLASAGKAEEIAVRLSEAGRGVYELEGRFAAPIPRPGAWAVLADYDRIDEFVPSVTMSRVLRRGEREAMVEQVIAGSILFFSRKVGLTLVIHEEAGRKISFRDVRARDFWFYGGEWLLEDSGPGTAVVYRLRARPKFRLPEFLCRRALRRGARDLLRDVRAEILRRADDGPRKGERP